MITFTQNGAMYAELEEGDEIQKKPIELGDGTLHPGEYVNKLGEKRRSSFEMQDGWYLKYVGRVNDVLLFNTNCARDSYDIYYAFYYYDKNTLLIIGRGQGYDIKVNKLQKFTDVNNKIVHEQLKLL